MLKYVHIKNLALIDEAEINYKSGLNIMTGETGSGKSIIIGGINIALGDKANKGYIRSGCNFGLVEICFSDCNEEVLQMLDNMQIERQEKNIVITRKITADSTVSKINGEVATLNDIKSLTSHLVDIHGQHEHQSLLNPQSQLDIIDGFGKDKISDLKSEMHSSYEQYKKIKKEFSSYQMDDEALEREKSLLEFELKEINDAALINGEDDTLEAEYKMMGSYEKLSGSLDNAKNAITNEQSGVIAIIENALVQISDAVSTFPDNEEIKVFKNTAADLDSLAKDLGHDLSKYIESHQFNRQRYSEIQKRLNLINKLKVKYGKSVNDILEHSLENEKKLQEYKNYVSKRNELSSELSSLRSKLNATALQLSNARKTAADILTGLIIKNLKELNFLNCDFAVQFNKADKITENGFDKIDFMISTNPGESRAPLAKIASGGELSRIMLAIKSSIAENDNMPTMIFDEIDTGISGKTAQMVAEKLNYLSKNHQIICITHLPQIAAMADTHFKIQKQVTDGTTISGICELNNDEQLIELASLLGGLTLTQSALENARELKEMAGKIK